VSHDGPGDAGVVLVPGVADVAVVLEPPLPEVLEGLEVWARPGPVEDGVVVHAPAPAPAASDATASTTRSLDGDRRRNVMDGESCRSGLSTGRAGSSAWWTGSMGKVRIGFFSFTEVTDPAEHRSYNEWHQLDHMPEQYPIPGVVFGQRWVSTPDCRRARAVAADALAPIHYMTLYLMGEPLDATLQEFRHLGRRLHTEGRFHQHRRSRLSGPFAVTGMVAARRVLVSAEAVPYRPNLGVYVVVRERAGAGAAVDGGDTGGAPDEDARLASALVAVAGVAGVWTFATSAEFDHHGWHPGDKTVTVCYLDAEPLAVAARLDEEVRRESGFGRQTLFCGPLQTITPWRWDWFDDA